MLILKTSKTCYAQRQLGKKAYLLILILCLAGPAQADQIEPSRAVFTTIYSACNQIFTCLKTIVTNGAPVVSKLMHSQTCTAACSVVAGTSIAYLLMSQYRRNRKISQLKAKADEIFATRDSVVESLSTLASLYASDGLLRSRSRDKQSSPTMLEHVVQTVIEFVKYLDMTPLQKAVSNDEEVVKLLDELTICKANNINMSTTDITKSNEIVSKKFSALGDEEIANLMDSLTGPDQTNGALGDEEAGNLIDSLTSPDRTSGTRRNTDGTGRIFADSDKPGKQLIRAFMVSPCKGQVRVNIDSDSKCKSNIIFNVIQKSCFESDVRILDDHLLNALPAILRLTEDAEELGLLGETKDAVKIIITIINGIAYKYWQLRDGTPYKTDSLPLYSHS